MRTHLFPVEITSPREDHLDLLVTYSQVAALPGAVRDALLEDL